MGCSTSSHFIIDSLTSTSKFCVKMYRAKSNLAISLWKNIKVADQLEKLNLETCIA